MNGTAPGGRPAPRWTWLGGAMQATAGADGRTATVFAAAALLEQGPSEIVAYPLAALAKDHGWNFLHAACVARGRNSALFIGRSMSGKTSFALALAARGARLLADETSVVSRKNGEFFADGFPALPQVREAALGNVKSIRPKPAWKRTPTGKWIVPVRGAVRPASVGHVIFVEYDGQAPPRFERIGSGELERVLERCTSGFLEPLEPPTAMLDHLLMLRTLARSGRVHLVRYSGRTFGDAVRRVDALLKRRP